MRDIVCAEIIINVINRNIDKPVVTRGIPDMFDATKPLNELFLMYLTIKVEAECSKSHYRLAKNSTNSQLYKRTMRHMTFQTQILKCLLLASLI